MSVGHGEPTPLARRFVDALGGSRQGEVEPSGELQARILDVLERARQLHPDLGIADECFVAYLAARLPARESVLGFLDKVHAADLYLACGCAAGDSRAIAALERQHGGHILDALRRVRDAHLLPDDFRQILRRKLFVGDASSPPAISHYAGLGALPAWLRVTASRTALNAVRTKRGPQATGLPDEDELELPESLPDPELQYLRGTYQAAFRESFARAVQDLPKRDRTLLRLSVVERIPVREIGKMYGTHHATAARWIARARQRLVERTHQLLAESLEISDGALDSVMALIRSRLDVSIARMLESDG